MKNCAAFLKFVWVNNLYRGGVSLKTREGRVVEVLAVGENWENHQNCENDQNHENYQNYENLQNGENCESNSFLIGAQITIDGERDHRNKIAFHHKSSHWRAQGRHLDMAYDDCAMNVVAYDDELICRLDGSTLPTVTLDIAPQIIDKYEELTTASHTHPCAQEFAALESVYAYSIVAYYTLVRLKTKYHRFAELRGECNNSWDEAFYITLFQTMGRGKNQAAYTKLAQTVRYSNICRIRQSPMQVEALLLGAAGLLFVDEAKTFPDEYTQKLHREFEHLSRRFGITAMRRSEWVTSKNQPLAHPVIRIAQLAALLSKEDLLFPRLLECQTAQQIYSILDARASQYWSEHTLPSVKSNSKREKPIGRETIDSMVINLVIPMMFSYGNIYPHRSELKERAMDLLENIETENNKLIDNWRAKGVKPQKAFYTQGLLQLSKLYCPQSRCAECKIGQNILLEVAKSATQAKMANPANEVVYKLF